MYIWREKFGGEDKFFEAICIQFEMSTYEAGNYG